MTSPSATNQPQTDDQATTSPADDQPAVDVSSDAAAEVGTGELESDAPAPVKERPEWAVLVCCGVEPADVPDGVRVVNLTTEDASTAAVLDRLATEELSPADLRSRVLFLASDAPEFRDRVLVAYAALCGFAGRRLDAKVGEVTLQLAEFDRVLRDAVDAGRPAQVIEQAQVGAPRDDMPSVDLAGGFDAEKLSVIRFARRLRFVAPDATARSLSELVAIAAIRARAGADRFPMLVAGNEPAVVEPVADTAAGVVGLCLHEVRRAAEQMRRSARGDTRDAIADFVQPSPRQQRLADAAACDLETVLAALGAQSAVVPLVPHGAAPGTEPEMVTVYRCLKPHQHNNGDATPSARILETHDGTPGFRCFRCLPETVDVLRLVMWVHGYTPDEAADWVLAHVA